MKRDKEPRGPSCRHNEMAVRVCWPVELDLDQPHASTWSCARQECVDDAARWVYEVTGHEAERFAQDGRRVKWPEQGQLFPTSMTPAEHADAGINDSGQRQGVAR